MTAAAVPAASTKTVNGTAHADVLRGTAGADAIYGRGGNDKLFGAGGNDLLVGGPGADRISCGSGTDRVVADHSDVVAGDCEKVTYTDGGGSTGTGVSTAAPPPPPATPPGPWQQGWYVGTTSQQAPITLQVPVGGSATSSVLTYYVGETCSGDRILAMSSSVTVQLTGSGAFDVTSRGARVTGAFNGGTLSGTLHVDTPIQDGSTCSSGDLTWSAQFVGATAPKIPTATDGHYTGTTAQGEVVNFDVVQGGRYIDSFTTSVGESCGRGGLTYANATFPNVSILGGAFVDTFDGSSPNVSTTVTFRGTFDGNGGVSGTIHVDSSVSLSSGSVSCSSGDVSWTAHKQ